MSIAWNDSYKIGEADIDAQHQELFRRANVLYNANSTEDLMAWAIGLFEYTQIHFEHEEVLMHRIGYPETDKHLSQHEGLLTLLAEVSTDIGNGASDMTRLEKFINYWLLTHIATFDAKLAAFEKVKSSVIVKASEPVPRDSGLLTRCPDH